MFSSVSKTLFIKFSNVVDYRQAVLVCVKIQYLYNYIAYVLYFHYDIIGLELSSLRSSIPAYADGFL